MCISELLNIILNILLPETTQNQRLIFLHVLNGPGLMHSSTGLVSQQQYVKMTLKTPVSVIIFLFKELCLSVPMLTFN